MTIHCRPPSVSPLVLFMSEQWNKELTANIWIHTGFKQSYHKNHIFLWHTPQRLQSYRLHTGKKQMFGILHCSVSDTICGLYAIRKTPQFEVIYIIKSLGFKAFLFPSGLRLPLILFPCISYLNTFLRGWGPSSLDLCLPYLCTLQG